MRDAISDTGPVLHLYEISQLRALGVFSHLIVPGLVADELCAYGLDFGSLKVPDLRVSIVPVAETHRNEVLAEGREPPIHPADAEVFILARDGGFQKPVLTDDLVLRRQLEAHGAVVIGSVGVLVRAFKTGRLTRTELEGAVDALFTESTLYLSSAFHAYVRKLLADLA